MTGQGSDDRRGGDSERVRVPVIRDGLAAHLPDTDPHETEEWLESFDAVVDAGGQQRARYLMLRMLERARERHRRVERAAQPAEIAGLAVFLASSDADYVTSATYVMDGGLMHSLGQGA